MSMRAVDSILQALIAGDQARRANIGIKQNEAQAAEQKRQFDEQMKLRIEQDKRQSAHDAAAMKAADAMRNLESIKRQQELIKEAETGTPTPGVEELSRRTTPEGDTYRKVQLPIYDDLEGRVYTDPSGQSNESVATSHKLPRIIEIRDPQTAARQEAQRQVTLMEPRIRLEAEKQAEIAKRESDRQAAQAALQAKRDEAAAKRQEQHDKAMALRDEANRHISGKYQVEAARIRSTTKENDLDNFNADVWINGINEGTFTIDEIKKQTTKNQANAIFNAANAAGVIPFTKEQKELKGELSSTAALLPLYDEFNNIFEQDPLAARIPGSETYKKLTQITGEINALLRPAARSFGSRGAISDKDAAAMEAGSTPEHTFLTKMDASELIKLNERKKDGIKRVLRGIVEAKLGNLSERQKQTVLNELGLVSGRIKVKRKSDGVVGEVSEQYFDSAKYEKVQ